MKNPICCNTESVKNVANHNEFYYCRVCKKEVVKKSRKHPETMLDMATYGAITSVGSDIFFIEPETVRKQFPAEHGCDCDYCNDLNQLSFNFDLVSS